MRPEPGDRSIQVHHSDIAAACTQVEIGTGDVVMFHSSLSSMGSVVGGPNIITDGFLEAVGPTGTICVPTFWWQNTDPPLEIRDWDINTSPSSCGLITEVFRQRSDSVRSDHPIFAVSAIGARAIELTADHGRAGLRPSQWIGNPFAVASPWQRLYDWNAAYCCIGVVVNTMRHFCETLFVEKVLQGCDSAKRMALEERVRGWEKGGVWPKYDRPAMEERLAEMGLVRFSRIGSATFRCIRTQVMVTHILAVLEAEPERWFQDDFLAWLRDAGGGVVA